MNSYPVRVQRNWENFFYEVARMATNNIVFDDKTTIEGIKLGDRAL